MDSETPTRQIAGWSSHLPKAMDIPLRISGIRPYLNSILRRLFHQCILQGVGWKFFLGSIQLLNQKSWNIMFGMQVGVTAIINFF